MLTAIKNCWIYYFCRWCSILLKKRFAFYESRAFFLSFRKQMFFLWASRSRLKCVLFMQLLKLTFHFLLDIIHQNFDPKMHFLTKKRIINQKIHNVQIEKRKKWLMKCNNVTGRKNVENIRSYNYFYLAFDHSRAKW